MLGGGALEVGRGDDAEDAVTHRLGVGVVQVLAVQGDEAERLALVEHRQGELAAVVRASVEAHAARLDQIERVAAVVRRVDELALPEACCPQAAVKIGEGGVGEALEELAGGKAVRGLAHVTGNTARGAEWFERRSASM